MSADTNETTMTTNDETESITVDDAGDVRLPVVELLTGRGFITGKSGSGKSNSASVVAEELLSEGFPLLIVDTDGEYYGLKEQFELLHAGADENCDIQVGPEHAEKLATLALEENVPIILDVSGYLDSDDADELIRETARHLFSKEKKLKKPFLLLVEEIHEYIPEGGGLNETGEMLVKVGKRGRKHGLGLVGISQRPADVKKDFITQCDWLVWHRLTWENDTKVVGRVVSKDVQDDVADLADGEAFLQTDWDEADVRRVQWRRKETFDAGATPGLEDVARPDLKSVSGDLVDELEDISERQDRREDEIEQLRDRLDEKDERIAELEQELDNARDVSNAAQQLASALQQDDDDAGVPEDFEEQLAAKNERIHELQGNVEDLEAAVDEREDRIDDLQSEVDRLESYKERVERAEELEDQWEDVAAWIASAPEGLLSTAERAEDLSDTVGDRSEDGGAGGETQATQTLDVDPLENRKVQRVVEEMDRRIDNLDAKERKMLRYLMVEGPAGMGEAYKYAGGSPTSGAKSTKMQTLRDAGLVTKRKQGSYGYAPDEYVADRLGDDFSEAEISAVVERIEDTVDRAVMEDDTE